MDVNGCLWLFLDVNGCLWLIELDGVRNQQSELLRSMAPSIYESTGGLADLFRLEILNFTAT